MDDIMKKSMVIYLLTDTTNGKQYVGKTMHKLHKRMGEHRRGTKHYVDRAIQKHGWENFTIEILEECATSEELSEREQYWIARLNTKAPNGYNLTDGGEGSPGRKATDEMRANMSASHPSYHVVCVETGMVFETAKEAAAWAGVQKEAIFRACNGISRTAGGYHWFYQEAPHLADHEVKVGERKNKRPVRCIETGQIFSSITEAARWAGVHHTLLIKVCQKIKHTAGGYHWEYVETLPSDFERNGRVKRAVLCVETGVVFESAYEAAKWAGCHPHLITRVCKMERKTCRGYHWEYVD